MESSVMNHHEVCSSRLKIPNPKKITKLMKNGLFLLINLFQILNLFFP